MAMALNPAASSTSRTLPGSASENGPGSVGPGIGGKDPVTELAPVAKYVTGFCAKDCPAPKGEVMSQFGTGKVDFKAVFTKLKSAGFNGPVMVEGVQVGATPEQTTANARANREFLEKVLAEI